MQVGIQGLVKCKIQGLQDIKEFLQSVILRWQPNYATKLAWMFIIRILKGDECADYFTHNADRKVWLGFGR